MHSILLVSHLFPPDFSVGAKRAHRMASHLSDLGWEVQVLTVRESYAEGLDASLADPAPRYRIMRTHAVDPRRWFRRPRLGGRQGRPAPTPSLTAGGKRDGLLARLMSALAFAYDALFAIPDARAGWLPIAVPAGLLCARKPDVILATLPPNTSAVVAAVLSTLRRVPLVLDYRDPWMPLPGEQNYPKWRRPIERGLQRFCLRRAAAVVATTRGLKDEMTALGAPRTVVIPNAFDPAMMSAITPVVDPRFTVLYAGTFYGSRSARPILEALGRLRQSGRLPARGLVLRIMGASSEEVAVLARDLRVDGCVAVEGFLPYHEALRRMKGADVLLLVVGDEHAHLIPAKFFDYLAARRFILALAPARSEAAALITELGIGVAVPPGDAAGIAEALAARFDLPRDPLPGPAPNRFEARTTMRDLDLLLREVVQGSRTGRAEDTRYNDDAPPLSGQGRRDS